MSRALTAAARVGNPPQVWKTRVAIGELRLAQGRVDEARQSFVQALDEIDAVARGLDDDVLRDAFLRSAHVQAIRNRAAAEGPAPWRAEGECRGTPAPGYNPAVSPVDPAASSTSPAWSFACSRRNRPGPRIREMSAHPLRPGASVGFDELKARVPGLK